MRFAVICAILSDSENTQKEFNEVIFSYRKLVKAHSGIPFKKGTDAVSFMVVGEIDEINALTGRLGSIPHTQVNVAISKREIENEYWGFIVDKYDDLDDIKPKSS